MSSDQNNRSGPAAEEKDDGGNDIAIRVQNLSKCYHLYGNPRDRLKQFVLPRLRRMTGQAQKQYFREFWSLRDISFEIKKGEALGIIGKNGAGKSTLLQILCGTLTPTAGTVETNGRVAALLELGAGFNPEFTGRENVYLNASVLGLSTAEIDARFDEIVAFADIGLFIDQPVKTYSSGMFVRLAFSIATCVEPDILVIDEALSVGDGEFSRKSFDRIMALKKRGTTILFCSHALYQTEVFCDRAMWLDRGRCAMLATPQEVVPRYSATLLGASAPTSVAEARLTAETGHQPMPEAAMPSAPTGQARFTSVNVTMDGITGNKLKGRGGESELVIRMEFACDPNLPVPTVGVTLDYGSLLAVTCVSSLTDQFLINLDSHGRGIAEITFSKLALRKGDYLVSIYLGCENALHFYDVSCVAAFEIEDAFPEPGLVTLPHHWRCIGPAPQQPNLTERHDATMVKVHDNYLMEIDSLDSLGLAHNNGVFEAEEVALCRLLLNKGDRVLDIGANIGYYTLLFGGLVSPTGSVFAIEPDAKNHHLLQKNLAENLMAGLVSAHQVALGVQAGSARLYHSDSNNGMHRLYASVCCTDDSTEVSVIAGDSLELAPLDLIKIDIEGYEPAALKGLSSTLAHSPNLKILCEFSPLSIWEAGFSPIQLLDEMQKHKFHLFCHAPDGWHETSFELISAQLEKIPEPAIASLIRDFEQEKNNRSLEQRASDFLIEHGYSRPVVENVLFVAPGAMEKVSLLIGK
jgi:lipopolysaccharide transport system ATP-binding protein